MYVTPKEVAKALGVPAYAIRAFLREKYGKQHQHKTSWHLNARMVLAVVAHFS